MNGRHERPELDPHDGDEGIGVAILVLLVVLLVVLAVLVGR